MNDLISRKALCDYALNTVDKTVSPNDIMRFPAAEPERTAKVERLNMVTDHNRVYKCTECGQYMHRTAWTNLVKYCSNCGARLEWDE